jgi:FKBP-type peptidyl-prolyl cis-trans isomerase FkpA
MKKIFTFAAIAAAALTTVSCGSNRANQLDSLSYAVGADLGMNLNFGMGELGLDNEVVIASLFDFYENGDVEGEEVMELRNRMMEFQYTRFMPYMNAKRSQQFIQTDCPDTLPALPELYDETFTRQGVSEIIGKNFGAWIKGLDTDFELGNVKRGINDALKLESQDQIDSLMLLTQEQMRTQFQNYTAKKQAEAQAERERVLAENAEASAKWLAEVEQMEGVQKSESGLLYRIDREGDGKQPTADTDIVFVNYEGKTQDGNIFDSSYERGEPISFPLDGVIKGWTEGLKYVKVGGQITLWIPAELAYGENGAGADIEPNQALEFKVELLEVKPAE